ncbi:MAG: glycosyltransferase [Pseudomonadota bacterium]
MATALSLIIPANNEAALIGACLRAVLGSDDVAQGAVQVIVAANGCSDGTVQIACGFADDFAARGWHLTVLDLSEAGKLAALDAADAAAAASNRAYLDADVIVTPPLIAQTAAALDTSSPRYVSGEVRLAPARTLASQLYGRFYKQVPFMQQPAPGCGYFAMNGAGRGKWDTWPRIISDDTFARLNFTPQERHQLRASYTWPLVEGFGNLVRVRRRQNAGVDEIARTFPKLVANDSKSRFTAAGLVKAILRAPLGFAVYASVALVVKLTPGSGQGWSRGR